MYFINSNFHRLIKYQNARRSMRYSTSLLFDRFRILKNYIFKVQKRLNNFSLKSVVEDFLLNYKSPKTIYIYIYIYIFAIIMQSLRSV